MQNIASAEGWRLQPKFVWLKRPKDCPKRAIGFDFDGAESTHVGSKVTFEVLLASFRFDADAAPTRLGALVHCLDVGGIPVPEVPGFAAIVSGARSLQCDEMRSWIMCAQSSTASTAPYSNPDG